MKKKRQKQLLLGMGEIRTSMPAKSGWNAMARTSAALRSGD